MTQPRHSINFLGDIGEAVAPASFPSTNYLIDDGRYPAVGNWAFCRFAGDDIPAARIGFTRGTLNCARDGDELVDSDLQLHIELMTREGALLWLATGRYRASQVISDPAKMDIRLSAGGREVFTIQGWPKMQWHFESNDSEIEIDLRFDLRHVAVLPDSVWPSYVFAMWWAHGAVEGRIRYQGLARSVQGSVFCDQPRVTRGKNFVALRKWYLYTPMRFQDGSAMVAYYAEDVDGRPIGDYCFGLFIDKSGQSTWLPHAVLSDLEYDADHLPRSWRLVWPSGSRIRELQVSVRETVILRSWGSPSAPQTRKDFLFIPLVLDGTCLVEEPGRNTPLPGLGLAEYWRRPLV